MKDKKIKKISKKKRIIIIISVIVLMLIAIMSGITKLIKKLSPVENITSNTIDIQFSTKEIISENVIIKLSTSTEYDIYYYIDFKNEETAEDSIMQIGMENSNENEINNITKNISNNITNANNTISNTSINSVNTIDNIYNNTTNSTSISLETTKIDINNNLYKKYNNEIVVENNATIYLKYARGNKFCDSAYSFEVNNIDKQGPDIGEIKTSATNSSITVKVDAKDNSNPNFTYFFKLAEDTEFVCTEDINEYTFTNLEKDKTYTIYVKVADGFGNESEAATDCTVSSLSVAIQKQKYYIKINIAANTVTIYTADENGEYTKPVKAMVCSTGKATPQSGTYNITYKYRWLALFGNVYGQYSTRIVGHILFHSVPYYSTDPSTLEYEEYDKLGTKASAGCIRLTVADSKWIYDNVASGSTVEFYSDASNPGPLGKPTAQKISSSDYRDWDPTDPDSRNPWLGGPGIEKPDQKNDEDNEDEKEDDVNNEVNNNTINNNEINNNTINNVVNNSVNNVIENSISSTENEIPWGTED